ncbi:hypothetical protein RN001_006653 [Aquatica leii]|uniref:Uncharacterized protein n=1 Tax=Aquatica leii TaxID=1421715 RepID=A0AAN7SJY3_9COLE|nr:hypothetical protein RN001_006653 [Aquatica leii]
MVQHKMIEVLRTSRIDQKDLHTTEILYVKLLYRGKSPNFGYGYTIDLPRFQAYTLESAHLFIEKYSWYCMPPTIHKVLIHEPIIIETDLLPIGQLSEEAQEANNKMLK